ncbi:MAG: hypothetical protein J0L73_09680 [Verrucomicrobia bacterium]|nr:hypothetical protein [Verrucomicrobiota bacterium]
MNKSFSFLTTLALLLFLGCQAIAKTQKPSDDMIMILIHHKSGPFFLDPKGLAEDKSMRDPPGAEVSEYEIYMVPHPGEGAFTVYLHIKSGRYWIRETGGAAASDRFYGPGAIKDLRKQ